MPHPIINIADVKSPPRPAAGGTSAGASGKRDHHAGDHATFPLDPARIKIEAVCRHVGA